MAYQQVNIIKKPGDYVVEIQFILAGAGAAAVIIGMQFKINRCLGRLEGELGGVKTMLTTHLNKTKV